MDRTVGEEKSNQDTGIFNYHFPRKQASTHHKPSRADDSQVRPKSESVSSSVAHLSFPRHRPASSLDVRAFIAIYSISFHLEVADPPTIARDHAINASAGDQWVARSPMSPPRKILQDRLSRYPTSGLGNKDAVLEELVRACGELWWRLELRTGNVRGRGAAGYLETSNEGCARFDVC